MRDILEIAFLGLVGLWLLVNLLLVVAHYG